MILLKLYWFMNSNLDEFIVNSFSYKAHFRPQISSNEIFISYQLEVPNLISQLVDIGFVKETLIFQTWSLGILFGQKYARP